MVGDTLREITLMDKITHPRNHLLMIRNAHPQFRVALLYVGLLLIGIDAYCASIKPIQEKVFKKTENGQERCVQYFSYVLWIREETPEAYTNLSLGIHKGTGSSKFMESCNLAKENQIFKNLDMTVFGGPLSENLYYLRSAGCCNDDGFKVYDLLGNLKFEGNAVGSLKNNNELEFKKSVTIDCKKAKLEDIGGGCSELTPHTVDLMTFKIKKIPGKIEYQQHQ